MNTQQLTELVKMAQHYKIEIEDVMKVNERAEYKQYMKLPEFKMTSPKAEERAFEITKRYFQIKYHR